MDLCWKSNISAFQYAISVGHNFPSKEEKGTTEDEMAGWHHRLDGREFESTSGDGDGQGGLAWYDSWGRKESDMTGQLNSSTADSQCCVITEH